MRADSNRRTFLQRSAAILIFGFAIAVLQSFLVLRPIHGPVGSLHKLSAPFVYPFLLGGSLVTVVPLVWIMIVGMCVAIGRWYPVGYTATVGLIVLHNLAFFGSIALANIGG
jgi:uncharacterized membrane protein YidH (DUF202 family)